MAKVNAKLDRLSELASKAPRDEHGRFISWNDLTRFPPKPVQVFKVGDRVEGITPENISGGKGTVVYISNNIIQPGNDNLIEFDDEIVFGHDGGGKGKQSHCRWCSTNDLRLLESAPVKEPKKDTTGEHHFNYCPNCGLKLS